MSRYTLEQWRKKGEELFGPNEADWKFVCPQCKMVLSYKQAEQHRAQLRGRNWSPYTECLGRHIEGVGCDWAAYGLFRGPDIVITETGEEIPVFEFKIN